MQILNLFEFNTIKFDCATTKWLVDVAVAVAVLSLWTSLLRRVVTHRHVVIYLCNH